MERDVKTMLQFLEENLSTEEGKEATIKFFKEIQESSRVPNGWLSIEDHLPSWKAVDFEQLYSEYRVKFVNGSEGLSHVTDQQFWYYRAKKIGITHWWNESSYYGNSATIKIK